MIFNDVFVCDKRLFINKNTIITVKVVMSEFFEENIKMVREGGGVNMGNLSM